MKFLSKKPDPVGSVPNLPAGVTQDPNVGEYTPLHNQKKQANKKMVIGIGILLTVLLIGITTFIATRRQPQVTKNKAATNERTIDIINPRAYANGTTSMTVDGQLRYILTPAPGTIGVNWKAALFHCDRGGLNNCAGPQVADFQETKQVPMDGSIVGYSHTFGTSEQCGTYQVDQWVDDGTGYPPDPTVGEILAFQNSCTEPTRPPTDTPPPNATNTPTPSPTTVATPTPTTAPNTYRVTGRVHLFCSNNPPSPSQCVATGSTRNGVRVDLKQGNTILQTDTTHDYVGSGGAFLFYNVLAGTYSVCTTPISGSQFYCGTGPTTGNCFSVTVPPDSTLNNVNLRETASCAPTPTNTTAPSPTPSHTPVPTNTTAPTPTKPANTPTTNPTPTSTTAPTPTNTIVVITATPTPTTVIVIAATNTPGPTAIAQATQSPTIPSAGSPLPYFAVGIPFILILIAFVL